MRACPGSQLRGLLAEPLMVPGVFNALSARMAERAGFRVLYLSGAAFSAGALALPDVGLTTLSELADETRRIIAAVTVPLVVDGDTGFGEAVNVERSIRMLEAAGAAAVQLEDQRLPKRCGHLSGKELVPSDEMVAKIQTACLAKRDSNFVVIARTDARGVAGFEDAVARARAYRQAGADIIFPEALETVEEFRRFRRDVDGPLVANMTEFGKSPLLAFDELAAIGYSLVLYPVTLLRMAMKAVATGLSDLKTSGTQRNLLVQMQTRQELYDILGYADDEPRERALE